MVTKKITSPATIVPSESATVAAAAIAALATPAKLPARKRTTATKPAVKKVTDQPAPPSSLPEKTSCAPTPAPAEKTKKIKMVRDSFTIPKTEYAALAELKQRAAQLGRPLKKSELLRAGLKLLSTLPDADLLSALADPAPLKKSK